jgi:hypothetical protein
VTLAVRRLAYEFAGQQLALMLEADAWASSPGGCFQYASKRLLSASEES